MACAWPVRISRPALVTAFCRANCAKVMTPISMMPSISAKKIGRDKGELHGGGALVGFGPEAAVESGEAHRQIHGKPLERSVSNAKAERP